MHAELRLRNWDQSNARRRLSDFCLETNSLIAQLPQLRLDSAHVSRLSVSVTSPRDDSCRCDDESHQDGRDNPTAANSYAALRHARSLALLARGLRSISASDVLIAFRFINVPSARAPQVH